MAMALNWSGDPATPDEVAGQAFTPGRDGSLQSDMLGAARRHGRIPYPVDTLDALLDEVAAGHPVVVLQNLALWWAPRWHYALVVGFDLERGTLTLHSGPAREREVALGTFEHTWRRAGDWAVVVLRPGVLPATAREAPYLRALVALERTADPATVEPGFAAASERWPESLPAWIGLGNARYARGELEAAEYAFAEATRRHPGAAPAWNNLAQVRLERGELEAARDAIERALELSGPLAPTYRETRAAIEAAGG